MHKLFRSLLLGFSFAVQYADAAAPPKCELFSINSDASQPLARPHRLAPGGCAVRYSNGLPIPDPACTPGAVNPGLTVEVLRDPQFRTRCVRDHATTAHEKAKTYAYYNIGHPANNTGSSQTCELDHLISLELGGADTLDNIWPQCGPADVKLKARYFRLKDKVENYLAEQVRNGEMKLEDAQRGIAADWTQFMEAAQQKHRRSRKHGD